MGTRERVVQILTERVTYSQETQSIVIDSAVDEICNLISDVSICDRRYKNELHERQIKHLQSLLDEAGAPFDIHEPVESKARARYYGKNEIDFAAELGRQRDKSKSKKTDDEFLNKINRIERERNEYGRENKLMRQLLCIWAKYERK